MSQEPIQFDEGEIPNNVTYAQALKLGIISPPDTDEERDRTSAHTSDKEA